MGTNVKQAAVFAVMIVCLLTTAGFAGTVPDTGQTQCYDDLENVLDPCPSPGQPFYGQDTQYENHQHSYSKLGENGVTLSDSETSVGGWVMTRDNVTGLIWEVKQNMDDTPDFNNPHDADNQYSWYDSNPETNGGDAGSPGNGDTWFDTEQFINALNSTHYGGFSDWRMPTVRELSYLIDSSIPYPGPTISTSFFPNTVPNDYWVSTTFATGIENARLVGFLYGFSRGYATKNSGFWVRAVRSGQPESAGHLVVNGDGTVTDLATGLMWQQETAPGTYDWQHALAYCENLSMAGYDDWRLPNRNELQSIIDYTRSRPAINNDIFHGTAALSAYFSSTTQVNFNSAWSAFFFYGQINGSTKSYARNVRAVRAGRSAYLPYSFISSSQSEVDFGVIASGSPSETHQIIISNAGTTDFIISQVELSGTNQADFAITQNICADQSISPGATCSIGLVFTPSLAEVESAILTIHSTATNVPELVIPLQGRGVTPGSISVSGVIKDWKDTVMSQPVNVTMTENPAMGTTASTVDGSFRLFNLPAATVLSLKFSGSGYLDVYTADMASSADMNLDTVGVLNQPTIDDLSALGVAPAAGKGLIVGCVADATYPDSCSVGAAVVTAASMLHPSTPYPVAYSDPFGNLGGTYTYENGIFYVRDVDDGDVVTLSANRIGWEFPVPVTVHTYADGVSELKILGTAPAYDASMSGSVKNAGGAAISNAQIQLYGNPEKYTTTVTDGSFTLSGLPTDACFYCQVTATGYAPVYNGPLLLSENITGVNLVMMTPGQLSGIGVASGNSLIMGLATDNTLNPQEGATVMLTSKKGASYSVSYIGSGSATALTGNFLIANVQANDVIKVEVIKTGYFFKPLYIYCFPGGVIEKRFGGKLIETGDIDGDGVVDLRDAIICLGICSGKNYPSVNISAGITGNGKIGISDEVMIMEKVSGLR